MMADRRTIKRGAQTLSALRRTEKLRRPLAAAVLVVLSCVLLRRCSLAFNSASWTGSSCHSPGSRWLRRIGSLRASADDLDDIVLLEGVDEDVDFASLTMESLLSAEEKNLLQEKDDFRKEGKRFPDLDGLSNLTGRFRNSEEVGIATPGMELTKGSSAKKKPAAKRWLRGRGSIKRQKMDENQALEDWLVENNVWISPDNQLGRRASAANVAIETKEAAENEVSGRGLVASREIYAEEVICKVPIEVCMSENSSWTAFAEEFKDYKREAISSYPAIAIQLIYEKFVMKEKSKWKAYLDILPTTTQIGASWTWELEEIDDLLMGSPLKEMSLNLRNMTLQSFQDLQGLFDEHRDKFTEEAFTWDNWVWAHSIVFSRGIRLGFEDKKNPDVVTLVPYVDLINHSPTSTSYIFGAKEGRDFVGITKEEKFIKVISDQFLKTFDQIYINYGNKANGMLLLTYGFSMQRLLQDRIPISLQPLVESRPEQLQKAIIRASEDKGIYRTKYTLLRDRILPELMQFLRVATISLDRLLLSENCSEEEAYEALMALDTSKPTKEFSELACTSALRRTIVNIQKAYPTTVDEDEALLKDRNMFDLLPKNQRNAIRARYSEKLIYRANVALIDRMDNNIGKVAEELEEEEKDRRKKEKDPWWKEFQPGTKKGPSTIEEFMRELDTAM